MTAAVRNICSQLPSPDFLVVYICNTAAAPLDVYRTLALELGLTLDAFLVKSRAHAA